MPRVPLLLAVGWAATTILCILPNIVICTQSYQEVHIEPFPGVSFDIKQTGGAKFEVDFFINILEALIVANGRLVSVIVVQVSSQ